jgi:hypothetical protein
MNDWNQLNMGFDLGCVERMTGFGWRIACVVALRKRWSVLPAGIGQR